MIRSVLSPVWIRGSIFPLSTQISSFRWLHQESKIFKFSNRHHKPIQQYQQCRGRKDDSKVSALFKPVPVQTNRDDINIGAELTGKLDKGELLKILNKFTQKAEIKMLCMEHGLDG